MLLIVAPRIAGVKAQARFRPWTGTSLLTPLGHIARLVETQVSHNETGTVLEDHENCASAPARRSLQPSYLNPKGATR